MGGIRLDGKFVEHYPDHARWGYSLCGEWLMGQLYVHSELVGKIDWDNTIKCEECKRLKGE